MDTSSSSAAGAGRPTHVRAVRNKAPAPVQITAEHLLAEAVGSSMADHAGPKIDSTITSLDELQELRREKREKFEAAIRYHRINTSLWHQYANWEASQNEYERARSVFERALKVDYRDANMWVKYAEMEAKGRFINSARNVWDRAVTLLPRVDRLWYGYVLFEEQVDQIEHARSVFDRWMEWQPDNDAWNAYVKFEMRQRDFERARAVFERWVVCHPTVHTFVRFARWEEEKAHDPDRARSVYERCFEEVPDEGACTETYFLAFCRFEERQRELDRARALFQVALTRLPKEKSRALYQAYTAFERANGTVESVEQVVLAKRRAQYEEELKRQPNHYDVWFDFIRLEEENGDPRAIREVYERAISHVPPIRTDKRHWARYIYLWIGFAVYEELVAREVGRARKVYEECLRVIPHENFTFTKVWLMLAELEVRCGNLAAARKVLGTAIGKAPKPRLFKGYIKLELQLGEVDRCRILYGKFIDFAPEDSSTWVSFARLEASLNEVERARAILELAIQQEEQQDAPDIIWKAYIDLEREKQEWDRARALYDRLLSAQSRHVRIWTSYAQFECSIKEYDRARRVFERAAKWFAAADGLRDERVEILDAWLEFEERFGKDEEARRVEAMMPERIKKRRLVGTDGAEWEEYVEYVFPEENRAGKGPEQLAGLGGLLQRAKQWKKQKETSGDGTSTTE